MNEESTLAVLNETEMPNMRKVIKLFFSDKVYKSFPFSFINSQSCGGTK